MMGYIFNTFLVLFVVNAGCSRTQKGNGIRQCASSETSHRQGKVAQSQPRGLGKPLQHRQFCMLLELCEWLNGYWMYRGFMVFFVLSSNR